MEGHRRVTLNDQMSASESIRERLAGLTLDDVLGNQKRPSAPPTNNHHQHPPKSRTLLDIIKEDESNKKDRRSWKAFKDKLRLKRAGSAWTSSIHIPTSDIPTPNSRNFHQFGRYNSVRFNSLPDSDMSKHFMAHQVEDLDPTEDSGGPLTTKTQSFRRNSSSLTNDPTENTGSGHLRPQLSRRNSTNLSSEPYRRGRVVTFRDSFDDDETEEGEKVADTGRTMSAREAVAAQEAAEAAAAAAAEEEAAEAAKAAPMSLMDLLEETDREMGLEGSRYILSDDEEFDDDDDEEGVEEEEDGQNAMEHTCCICMVRHKGAAFIPCGHTFCRMCSREQMVSKGNCPICNNFISEILDIF